MQGGVCYNEAIPAAMAALTGKEIVVPPEPGLMGAFGVALEVERRIERGFMKEATFDLNRLGRPRSHLQEVLRVRRRKRKMRPPLRNCQN